MDDFRPRSQRPIAVPKRPLNGQSKSPQPLGYSQIQPQPQRNQSQLPAVVPSAAPSAPVGLDKPSGLALGAKKKSRKWIWFIVILALLLAAITALTLGAWSWYSEALKAKSNDEIPIALEIETGATIDQVAQELEQKSVIKSAFAFSLYMKFNGKDSIKTGSYLIAPNQPVEEIVNWLNEGRVSTRRVTILPGQTLKQIATTLEAHGFKKEAVDVALSKKYQHPVLADKPADATLEGYIYPETYFVTVDSAPDELVKRSLDEFEKQIKENGIREKLATKKFNLFQAITLASIITKEASNVDDQKQVSQVFQTRLAEDISLGSDVTYQYAADMLGVERAVNLDSPYNTRIHTGLPPGPIANFNLSALMAVADPSPGDYLYFVAGDDGAMHFSHTIEEHEVNIQKYCHKLCAEA